MLNKHELPVVREEAERVDTLRYSWERMQATSAEVSTHLVYVQPDFKGDLIENVKIFVKDCGDFYRDYDKVMHFILS